MNTQLDLFEGLVLTTNQQEEVNRFIKRQAERADRYLKDSREIMLMLDRAGFVQGVDYNSNFKVEEVTEEREFGYSYNNTNYMHEVTFKQTSGIVYLLVNHIKDGGIKTYKSSISREGDKLMCTSITSQYRHYKPSSLFTKFIEYNKSIVEQFGYKNKQNIALNIIVAKYQKLFPNATVIISSDCYRGNRNYDSFPIVQVEFISGSWVSFRLGYGSEMEKEQFHKKYDAQPEYWVDTLEKFNNQKAK